MTDVPIDLSSIIRVTFVDMNYFTDIDDLEGSSYTKWTINAYVKANSNLELGYKTKILSDWFESILTVTTKTNILPREHFGTSEHLSRLVIETTNDKDVIFLKLLFKGI